MTSVDPPVVVSQIQALQATLGSLGASLSAAAPQGAFSSVLDAVQSQMADIGTVSPAAGSSPATSTSLATEAGGGASTAFLSTAGLLGASDIGASDLGASSIGSSTAVSGGAVLGSSAGDPLAGLLTGSASGSAATTSGISASLGVPTGLVPLFEEASARSGVPAALLAAVAKQESGFNPSAVSSAGAQGLMQLMPSTAAGLGVNAYDPQQAIDGAATLLSNYLQQYGGSVPLTLAAYNAGPGAVAQYGGIPPYAQTQNYVASIMASLGMAS